MSYNLPPGCTMNDIDPPQDGCPECKGEGEIEVDDGEWYTCETCSGLGVINTRSTGPSTRDKE